MKFFLISPANNWLAVCFFSPPSLTWTHLPSATRCIQTYGTISKRSVLLKKDVLCLILLGNECFFWILAALCLFSGSWQNTRYSYSIHCPWHHEPLDPPDGLSSGHYWHPDRKYHSETLPVGSRICSGEALSVQVGIGFTLFCRFQVDDRWWDWSLNALSSLWIHFYFNHSRNTNWISVSWIDNIINHNASSLVRLYLGEVVLWANW